MTQAHARITSPFSAQSTAREVAEGHDLTGKTAIVTGASAGLGIETARALAGRGADVTLAVRDTEAGQKIADAINQAEGRLAARVARLELGSLASVRDFARSWGDRPLHLLIDNAGIMACPLGYTEDGFETQFGVNHLGHFLLTVLLAPALVAAAPARVVVLSSGGHQASDIHWDDPHYRSRPYTPFEAYGQSKTANILFAIGFTRRFAERGVTANSVMPGVIHTSLGRHLTPEMIKGIFYDENGQPRLMPTKSPEQGAATSVWAAVGSELEGIGGLYLADCAEAALLTPETAQIFGGVKPYALDPASAERLWALSVKETGAPQ